MLGGSFPFRMAYYMTSSRWKAGNVVCLVTELLMISCFYTNVYANMSFLLWTGINRCVTVTRLCCKLLLVFKQPCFCWFLSLSVGIFFFMLSLTWLSNGLLVFHLHKVNRKSGGPSDLVAA